MEKIAIPVKNATITEPKQDVPSEKKVLIATRVDEPYFAAQSQNPVDSPDDALPMIPVQNLIVNDEPSVRKMQKICELVNPTAGGDILSQDLTNFSNHEHPTIFNQMAEDDSKKLNFLMPNQLSNSNIIPFELLRDDTIQDKKDIHHGSYYYKNGVLYHSGKQIMNAFVYIVESIVSDGGSFYKCKVVLKNREIEKIIPISTFVDGKWLKSLPGFVIYCKKGEYASEIFEYLNHIVQEAPANVQQLVTYPGWIKHNKTWCYVSPNGVIGQADIYLNSQYGQHFQGMMNESIGEISQYLQMRQLTPNSPVATILMLYTVQSFIYKLFKCAGFVPKYLIFLHGPRGSYKTSLALMMTQLEHHESPQYTLKATPAGIEAGFRDHNDSVMLIDDLAPVQDTAERNRMHKNLELLVRAFGDGTGKKRNLDFQSARGQKEQYIASGGAVLTGEYITGIESSLARCIFLSIKAADVDIALLSHFQQDFSVVPRFFAGFLPYISNNFERYVEFIQKNIPELRRNCTSEYVNPRYAEYYAQLTVASQILLQYGIETGQINPEFASNLQNEMVHAINQVLDANNEQLKEEAPILHICRSILNAIEQGHFKIVDADILPENNDRIILEDEDYYYIKQTDVKIMYEEYNSVNGFSIPKCSATNLARQLANADIIVPIAEGKTVRFGQKIPGHGNTRYMKLNKLKLLQSASI